jgi:hypothetical protein
VRLLNEQLGCAAIVPCGREFELAKDGAGRAVFPAFT